MIETTREQDAAVHDICRDHGGALCQITRPPGFTTGIAVLVYETGTRLDDAGALSGGKVAHRYCVAPNGRTYPLGCST
jgi:hypothetical protein